MGTGHLQREDRALTGNGPLAERSRKVRKLSSCLFYLFPLNPDPVGFLLIAPLSPTLFFFSLSIKAPSGSVGMSFRRRTAPTGPENAPRRQAPSRAEWGQ
jgi:hypothetical protein